MRLIRPPLAYAHLIFIILLTSSTTSPFLPAILLKDDSFLLLLGVILVLLRGSLLNNGGGFLGLCCGVVGGFGWVIDLGGVLPFELVLLLVLIHLLLITQWIRVEYLLINSVELLPCPVGLLHLLGLPDGDGCRGELCMHDLQGVTHYIIRLGQRAEGGQDLVVDALCQHHLVEGVLEPVAWVFIIMKVGKVGSPHITREILVLFLALLPVLPLRIVDTC